MVIVCLPQQGHQMHMNGSTMPHPTTARKAQLARQSAEFMRIARSIGRDIANTYTKLEKLTMLAKRKTIFDDRPQEIQVAAYHLLFQARTSGFAVN